MQVCRVLTFRDSDIPIYDNVSNVILGVGMGLDGLAAYLEAYLENIVREGKSEHTVAAYRRDLQELLALLEEMPSANPSNALAATLYRHYAGCPAVVWGNGRWLASFRLGGSIAFGW